MKCFLGDGSVLKKILLSLLALVFMLGYDTDEELVARVKVADLEHSYNSRVLGRFDESGHLLFTPRGIGICISQMKHAKATFEDLHKHYASTDALSSQETWFLKAEILNILNECERLNALRG